MVRSRDGHLFTLLVLPVTDVTRSRALAAQQMAVYDRIGCEHLVNRHSAIDLADGTLGLVLDEVTGGTLAQLLGARGQLTVGEVVTIVAPLFRALADLHAANVVHGDLAPGNVVFGADGRPLIGDLGVALLLGTDANPAVLTSGSPGPGTSGFVAPEVVDGAATTPSSDVYAMAALGWFCLAGAAPAPAATRPSLATLRPETPRGLVELLNACMASDPAARPTAATAAVQAFDSAPAESVALAPVSDPAAEITRRIRVAAASVPDPAPPETGKTLRRVFRGRLAAGCAALVVAVALAASAAWFLRPAEVVAAPPAGQSASARPPLALATSPPLALATRPALPLATRLAVPLATQPAVPLATRPPLALATRPPATLATRPSVTLAGQPRMAPAALLQALVDARALAYRRRSTSLLDLVYARGAAKAGVDKDNIATAVRNGGTYLGLSFVVEEVKFVGGTSSTARVRATIRTAAYLTGQPDGRTIPHAQEVLGPCIFSLSLTPEGWRIVSLTTA